MPRDLPSGTVTFLFTDIEGSTKLLRELGTEGYAAALAEHRRTAREAFAAHGGVEVDTQGDAFFVAFPTAPGALRAAADARDHLAGGPIRVRAGIHTGAPHRSDEGYVGIDVHHAARIAAAGHGGQILVSGATAAVLGTDGLRELGEHRFKDFAAPIAIYQLGTERFPPLKTISNTNLPRPASSFVGRERELAELVSLLRDGARLVTLTGPGGSGKTRLAIEAAARLVPDFKAGVFWVELAPIRDPALVSESIAQMLGARESLADHIAERELLLVLDNLEQVIEGSPALASLVERCPNLTLLTTSRERLRVRGETEYSVAPLTDGEAVALFASRARVEPDVAVAELCCALDNLPLAIELAAARAGVLTPAQILARLGQRLDALKGGRDADPRQQTLRATIGWSHELLTREQQHLFARLAVFRGGATLEAAEQIAGADLDTLESLVDKSLVRRAGERFWMLETVLAYATERLEETEAADALRRRHAERFLELAEEAEPHLAPHEKEWLERVEREHDNLRAALDWAAATGETQLTLRLAAALYEFWSIRGHFAEGRRRLDAALAADPRPTAARAKALNAAADLSDGDVELARRLAEEALEIHRAIGDPRGIATSLFCLGSTYEGGDWARARDLWAESARLFGEVGDRFNALFATRMLVWSYAELGERERAQELSAVSLAEARALGYRHLQAHLLEGRASAPQREGRPSEAVPLLLEALGIHRETGDLYRIAVSVGRFASLLAATGRPVPAARVLACSVALLEEIGGEKTPWVAAMRDQTLASIHARIDDAAFAAAWEAGRTLTADAAVKEAVAALV